MKVAFVCLLAAMAFAGVAAKGEFNFFPSAALPKAADGKPQLVPFPAPWTLEAQTAYPELGNAKGKGLLKISVNDYFPDGPTLYVVPGAWCDTADAAVAGPLPNGLVLKGSKVQQESGPAPADDAAAAAADAAAAPNAARAAAPNGATSASNVAAPDAAAPAAEVMPVAAVEEPAAQPADGVVSAASVPEAKPAPATAKPVGKPVPSAAGAPRRLMQAPNAAEADAAAPAANAAAPNAAAPNAAVPTADAAAPAADAAAPAADAAAPAVVEEAGPAPTLFTVDAEGTCSRIGDVTFKLSGDSPAQVAEKVELDGVEVYKVALAANLADGPLCFDISANYDTSKVKTTPAYTETFEQLGDTTAFTRTVCLYKLTKQANARLEFDMCTDNKFMLNISNITPLPVNVTLGDKPTDANLFRPLVKVWGGKVAELDGTPTEPRSYDEVASRTMYNWVAKYFPISASYGGEPLSYTLSDTLQEGYYEVSSVVSVMTKYPELNSLIGLTQITQEDASGTEVKGLWEAAARQVHYKTIVGVQKGSTPTTISKISSSSHTPGQTVLAGQKLILNWQFRGVGSATCTHDGMVTSNAADGKCVSPLTVEARDVAAVDTKHNVVVTFTDVCGRVRTAEFAYTQAGVVPVTEPEVLASDGSIQKVDKSLLLTEGKKGAAPGGSGKAVRSGAAAAGVSALAGAAAGAVALFML